MLAGEDASGLQFVSEFTSNRDVKGEPSTAARAVDILAGPPDVLQMVAPQHVTTDSRHRVIVADPSLPGVHVFDFEAKRYFRIEAGGDKRIQSPAAVAVDGDDNIYVTDATAGLIVVYDPRGKFLRYFGKIKEEGAFYQSPGAIAIDRKHGRIYVSDTPRHLIFMLDMNGNVLAQFGRRGGGDGPGDFKYPTAIAVNNDELMVLDSRNVRVQILDLHGKFRRQFKLIGNNNQALGPPTGMGVDREGRIYVADGFPDSIQVFSEDGQFLCRFGHSGSKRSEFKLPVGIWVDVRDRIYIADSNNHRVQVFRFGRPR